MRDHLKTLFPACAVEKKSFLYYITHEEHALKRMNILSGKVEYIDNPKGYDPFKWMGADVILYKDEKLYLFEQNGRWMMEYSILNAKSKIYEINCSLNSCLNIAAVSIYNDSVYICPSFRNVMIIVDLKLGQVTETGSLCPNKRYVFAKESEIYMYGERNISVPHRLFSCGCRVETNMWIFLERESYAICYDLLLGKVKEYQLPTYIKGCVHAVWKDGKFYVLSVDGNVYLWHVLENKAELLWESGGNKFYPYFHKIAVTQKNIWVFPSLGNDIYIVDLKVQKGEKYDAYPKGFQYYIFSEKSRYFEFCEDDEYYYFAMHCTNFVLIIDKASGEERWLKPIEPNIEQKLLYYVKNHRGDYTEGQDDLKKFLNEFHEIEDFYKQKRIDMAELIWSAVKEENRE